MDIAKKLDLSGFLADFTSFFARKGTEILALNGDLSPIKQKIDELSKLDFNAPNETKMLDNELALLKKSGILKLDSIYEFVKIIKYFLYLKSLKLPTQMQKSLDSIIIPQEILEIINHFENDGNIRNGWNLQFDSINLGILATKKELKKHLDRLLSNPKLSPFLVDKASHFIDGKEALLLNAGFNAILKGKILHRTQAGFFYIMPHSLEHIYDKLERLENQKEILIYEIEKDISLIFQKNISFLQFINKEFDRFDALQARVFFAKERNFEFILPYKKSEIILADFCHPNIKNPTPCNVDFNKQILLITGVNAGGKTMLLKSILSAVFLSNMLIPFKINPHKSKIPQFAIIEAIINDPQDSKNDISTFAGRMLEFSKILATLQNNQNANILLGIDEIELGTDANEASALYLAILEHLKDKHIKIIITTHHKILASKMADSPNTELMAALYDEKNRTPTYQFLKGTIGKSYAFESAKRFGIPQIIIQNAQKLYSQELENLNALLEQTSMLKTNLLEKEAMLNKKLESSEEKIYELNDLIERQNVELGNKKAELEAIYNQALSEIKQLLKHKDTKEIHRFLNAQHKHFSKIPKESKKHIDFKVGDRIAQGKNIGIITHIKGENIQVELENGVRVKTYKNAIKPANKIPPQTQSITITKSIKPCSVSLDLHGKRVDEALTLLDEYISNCLMAGFNEVIIKHGIGSGVLSAVVKDFLKSHPKVASFSDAPPQMGGFGAKIVKF